MIRKLALALTLGAALVATPAQALLATCTVNSPTVAFGSYSVVSSTPLDATGTVTVTCSALLGLLVSFTVQLSPGNSGNQLGRYMTSGAPHLSYNIYTDSGRTNVWGDGTGGTGTLSGSFLAVLGGASQSFTVYGRVPVSQAAPAGSYSDTLTITVNY